MARNVEFYERNFKIKTKFQIQRENALYLTIGDNSVIGAGSVVTKDVPSNVIAVGNPCRVLREINENDRKYYFKNREINL